MLAYTDDVVEVLRSHHVGRVFGVASYQGSSVELQVEPAGSVSFQGDSVVQAAASIHVFGYGDSLVPRLRTDFLAPYGQEVALFREVIARNGSVVATVPLGVYRVTGNGGARETVRVPPDTSVGQLRFLEVETGLYAPPSEWGTSSDGLYEVADLVEDPPGSGLYLFDQFSTVRPPVQVLDWELDVDLADRFRMIERSNLLDPKSPVRGNSVYDELRRLSPVPVQESLPDDVVPRSMVYEDRISAIRALAELLGGVPHMTRQGVLTVRPKDAWLTNVDPVFDISGTVTWEDGMSDEFYNYVRAASNDDRFVAYAQLNDDSDPLSVNRAGRSTYSHSSPAYTTKAKAQAGANTILKRLLNRRSRQVTVSCTPDALLLELGDVGWMRDPNQGRAVLGEVSGIRVSFDPTQPVEVDLIVAEER